MNPFEHLSLEEQRVMIARSSSGEHPIFVGEEANGPIINLDRHGIHSGQFFEVEPDQLIDVAKHIATAGIPAQETIQRAYTLICEAHLTCRNIRHWNEMSRRGHVSKNIHEIVEKHTIKDGKNAGKVPRLDALGAFLTSKGKPSYKTDDGKLFRKWVKDSLRHRSYTKVIPWNPSRDDFDNTLYTQLLKKGWIRWINIGSGGHLILPDETAKPTTKPRRKFSEGEHVTRPWWGTKNVWWPSPSEQEIKEFQAEFLIDNSKHFRNAYLAKEALEKFERWLTIQDAIKENGKTPRKKNKRNSETGQFTKSKKKKNNI